MYQSRGTDGGSEVMSNQVEHIKIQEEERPNLGNILEDNSPPHVTYSICTTTGLGKERAAAQIKIQISKKKLGKEKDTNHTHPLRPGRPGLPLISTQM